MSIRYDVLDVWAKGKGAAHANEIMVMQGAHATK
jgi:hypothetical protein